MYRSHISVLVTLIVLVLVLSACGEKATELITTEPMAASGEFLFEGPNTLQGNFSLDLSLLSEKAAMDENEISEVSIERVVLDFDGDDTAQYVESVLVQLVSNDLPLVSAATLSGLNGKDNTLNVNSELDILSYIKDSSSQLIVDANLMKDMDEMIVSVTFELTIKY